MSDPPPIVLAYANPRAAQPAGSRFAVESFDDGVDLTRPLDPNWWTAAALAVVAVATMVIAVGRVAGRVFARDPDDAHWPASAIAVVLLVGLSVWLLRAARTAARPRVQRVTFRGGRITGTHCPWTVTGRPWSMRGVRSVVIRPAGSNLFTKVTLGSVVIKGPLGVGHMLLANLPYDECRWMAALLNAAISGPTG